MSHITRWDECKDRGTSEIVFSSYEDNTNLGRALTEVAIGAGGIEIHVDQGVGVLRERVYASMEIRPAVEVASAILKRHAPELLR